MLNELLVAWVSVAEVSVSVWPVPTLSIVRFANVATPFTAFTGPLPDSVAPPALPRAREIAPVKLGTVFPDASRAVTVTAGVIATPTCVLLGCTPNARCVAGGGGPAVMLNELLVEIGRASGRERGVYPVLAVSFVRYTNVGTPCSAVTWPLFDSVAASAFGQAREIGRVLLGSVFPDASRAVTVTAGVIATPTCVLLGCTPNARCVAGGGGPAVMLNELLVAWVRSEEHTSELQSLTNLVCRLLLEKKKQKKTTYY